MTSTERQPPMGSEDLSAPYIEKAPQSNEKEYQQIDNKVYFEKWKNSFEDLLKDLEGSQTFYEFLVTEQIGVLFECWHCCEEYRSYPPNKATAKEVYSRYVRIKDTRVPISDQARNNLALRLRANDVTETLLLEIEQEVYANLRDVCYPKFLKSNFYSFYCDTSGQIRYEANEFHKFSKPSTLKRPSNLSVVHETQAIPEQSYDLSSALTPYEKGKDVRTPNAAKCTSDFQSLSTDVLVDSDRLSMADSRTSGGSGSRYSRGARSCNHDQLPDPDNFKPRTQRLNQDRLRQMKPEQFAALLTEKLQRVILDREMESRPDKNNMLHSKEHHPSNQQHAPMPSQNSHYQYENDTSDTQSLYQPPQSDRYSIAGASSHSGSGVNVEKSRNIKEKANELRKTVRQFLRSHLGECQCQDCFDNKMRHNKVYNDSFQHCNSYPENRHTHECSQNSRYSSTQTCCCPRDNHHNIPLMEHSKYTQNMQLTSNSDNPHEQFPPVDKSKIYAWMEKNEKYKNHYPEPLPSPAVRKKKQTAVYDNSRTSQGVQPIAQDIGMPILPQPDTGNVLEEVKRVLTEPSGSQETLKKYPGPRSHHSSVNQPYYHDQHSLYSDMAYEHNSSMVSGGNWSQSDGASIISYNPSQISTVPSSASKLWNTQGYYESKSDVRFEHKSEARSHSTGRHSTAKSMTRSTHSDHRNKARPNYSDVRSQTTSRSHGSDNSRGRSKNTTTVTYYFCGEPIPYRINVPSTSVTLAQFKHETKRGNYRFFFKTKSEDDGEVVFEEIKNDHELLPRYEDKIIGKVEKIE